MCYSLVQRCLFFFLSLAIGVMLILLHCLLSKAKQYWEFQIALIICQSIYMNYDNNKGKQKLIFFNSHLKKKMAQR